MDMNFNSITELYNTMLPILTTKVNEMKLRGISYIKERDIWDYQKEKWCKTNNLIFSDMVNDILNTSNDDYEKYLKQKWEEQK